ncbi:ammonia-forming cytochrome c nitrite reductase [Termitidicoccus mucosus]|uniref:nitrite reductase (cytochrome; ammonia-forming) n=1 Tax=Termitidicoccus mucosus TaxID=1184151 RepID=A0A178IMC1_9BACT|nr:cytochrome c nitrite reductase [Opitutaceae bacterium TSB47]
MKKRPLPGWLVFAASLVVTFALGLLASSIMERRAEALQVNTPLAAIKPFESRNSAWGDAYPRQYGTLRDTRDMSFTPPVVGAHGLDALGENPRQVILWAGYAFAKDYNHPRGHAYAVEDVRNTLRTGAPMKLGEGPQPASCWVCKSPDVPRLMNELGIDEFYKRKWSDLGGEVTNHIGCADCHDPKTMKLSITRPHLAIGYKAATGRDISTASHQEMRTLACAQCHVEYYFDKTAVPGGQVVTLPWKHGFTVEAAEKYYDEAGFTDFVNPISKAPIIKAQHPDYELWQMGIHGQRGVSCADCHMPYTTDGSQKFSSHHVQSPLADPGKSCQVCHRQNAGELLRNVTERQTKIADMLARIEQQLVHAHFEAKAAWDAGATGDEMKPVLQLIRQSQWRWDFVAASHGASFHAPLECARILDDGLARAGEARLALARILARHGQLDPVALPDLSTKEKAQSHLGLDIASERAAKAEFIRTVVPQWLRQARENGTLDENAL